ncbi:MAG TPA: metallophosphoesterase family protein [Terriglobales bacterium]|nr:metallophosphoesterase family protein [Terriglobales bacterium]
MRIAALFDIHGNLPALEAVLADARAAGVDRIVVGGDIVVGPMTREALEFVRGQDIPLDFIYGNCEVAVLDQLAGRAPKVPAQYRPIIDWTAEQHRNDRDVLASWPLTLRIVVPGIGTVLFCHATPRNEDELFLKTTAEQKIAPLFDGLDAALVACGHTHMQFDRRVGTTRVVNAGSVGQPFGESGAHWLLLGPDVELRQTSYDLEPAVRRIRATSYPGSGEFVANLLQPPAEQQMLSVFSKAELDARM